jgi:DNA-binding response OmpR family regulator/cob(I)alamin adenosyltransferase
MNDFLDDRCRGDVLIVDDSFVDLSAMSELLESYHYQVRRANHGKMALRMAQTPPPDLILLDIHLPDINGYELCQKFKENSETADIPVIFVSASDQGLDKLRAFNSGGSDYIEKPLQIEELIVRIENQLKVRRANEALKEKNARLENTLVQLQETQALLFEAERVSTLGKIVRNIAHEIEMPMNFMSANLQHVQQCCTNIVNLLRLYDELRLQSGFWMTELQRQKYLTLIKADVLDITQLLGATTQETAHIGKVALSISQLFSDDAFELQSVDIRGYVESMLSILRSRLNAPARLAIQLTTQFQPTPLIICYINQLSQALFIILSYAVDALEAKIATLPDETQFEPKLMIGMQAAEKGGVAIAIHHNGMPPSELLQHKIANPKTGGIWDLSDSPFDISCDRSDLGLFISYQIITEKHQGQWTYSSGKDEITEFVIELPLIAHSNVLSTYGDIKPKASDASNAGLSAALN